MERYESVFESNRRWAEGKLRVEPEFFEELASGQDPDFLYIGCSDSRVPANEVMGLDPGQVFVHRNVANLVVNTDLNAQSVIEYAVTYLKVDYIIVCGHYGCGGVQAAMQPEDMGLLNGWLREVRDIYRLHREELDAIADEGLRYRRLVELNVQEQCVHILKTASVQKEILRRGKPTVHGWTFDLADGLLRDLNIPFDEILKDIRQIYRLDLGDK
jgi:carbonic anhydrase